MKKFKLRPKYRPNKKVYTPEQLLKAIIDAELRPYSKTFEDINTEEKGIINGVKWFEYYTFKTKEQEDIWNEYCSKLIRKHWKPWYISKREADKCLSSIRLEYGLMSEYLNKKTNEDTNNS
jgi:hypothetical protein|nr:MAG TPA: hypothetical protein [Crassvirales sp.]